MRFAIGLPMFFVVGCLSVRPFRKPGDKFPPGGARPMEKYMNRTKNTFRRFTAIIFSILITAAFMVTAPSPVRAAAGSLDNTFDGNGKLATDFNGGYDFATDVMVQPDGKIVVVGCSGSNSVNGEAVIARYNVNGSLDTTFSDDGKLVLGGANCGRVVVAVAWPTSISPKIVVAYWYFVPSTIKTLKVTRLNSNGTPDPTFDTDGTADSNVLDNYYLGDIAVQSDAKIIVVGGHRGTISGTTPDNDWSLHRFTSAGALDTTFSGDGRQQTDFGGSLNEFATSVKLLSNGTILVGGTGNPADQVFALARYTTNGSLDTNWGGGDGKVVTDLSNGNDITTGMTIDASGRILLAGSARPGGVQTGAIVRYNADGLLDTSFDGDGILQTASFGPVVEGIDLQELDGKIIGVGGTSDFIIGRLNQNGSPDSSFGNAGFVVTDMNNNSSDQGRAVAISFDRRVVVAGSTLNTTAGATTNFCVARYLPTNIPYRARFDFDGDNKSDIGILRPGNGQWWINRSGSGVTTVDTFGNASNRMAPLDFTGDGKADIAFWRPQTGEWFILRSENSSFYAFPFGMTFDLPAPGDYDGDGKADAAVFRPSTATWYISQSSGAPTRIEQFGISSDVPIVADYDEDGMADVGIFRPGPREWWIQRSTAGLLAIQFGNSGDKPVQGDYTGDGKADVAVFRPSTGEWFIVRSEDLSFYGFPFGMNGDVPAPADYDGDGRFDPTVVRGSTWFIARTTSGTQILGFGSAGDRPIANAFVP